jgi:orotate phosphoribosyltransferase
VHWISYSDMHADMRDWAASSALLQDAAAFIGIPRSGLLIANVLALHLNKHLLPMTWLRDVRRGGGGHARPLRRGGKALPPGPIVVLDDSCLTGKTLKEVVGMFGQRQHGRPIHYAVPYTREDAPACITETYRSIPRQAVFAWNWAHQARFRTAVTDLDGVIHPEIQDGLRSPPSAVRPLLIPSYPPLAIATGRRERYRPHTQAWLDHWRVDSGMGVHMMPTDKEEHADVGGVIGHKCAVARTTRAQWFVESSAVQAEGISYVVPTLCTETWRMYANGRPRG